MDSTKQGERERGGEGPEMLFEREADLLRALAHRPDCQAFIVEAAQRDDRDVRCVGVYCSKGLKAPTVGQREIE